MTAISVYVSQRHCRTITVRTLAQLANGQGCSDDDAVEALKGLDENDPPSRIGDFRLYADNLSDAIKRAQTDMSSAVRNTHDGWMAYHREVGSRVIDAIGHWTDRPTYSYSTVGHWHDGPTPNTHEDSESWAEASAHAAHVIRTRGCHYATITITITFKGIAPASSIYTVNALDISVLPADA